MAEAGDVLLEAPGGDALEGAPGPWRRRGFCRRCGGFEDGAEGGGEGGDVADGEDAAFDAVGDEVGVAAYVGGDDDGAAGGHGFVDDEAPGLVARGEDEDGGELEEAGQLGLVAEAGEADAGEAGRGDLGFEAGALFAVADDDEVGVGLRGGPARRVA